MIGFKKKSKSIYIKKHFRTILIALVLPYTIILIILFSLAKFNNEYTETLQNATLAAEFNEVFKTAIDDKVYYCIIDNRNIDEMPFDEVDKYMKIIESLKETTTSKANVWRVNSTLSMCDSLKEYMVDIQNTKSYDERIQKYTLNIESITTLIQEYMTYYIQEEIAQSTIIQRSISNRILNVIVFVSIVSTLLIIYAFSRSSFITNNIVSNIDTLCDKIKMIGNNVNNTNLDVVPIDTNISEIKILDEGFNTMAIRIDNLVEGITKGQEALRKAEFDLLQEQIKPHFLYNTFTSIIWLAEANQKNDVVDMTTNLSTFFRNSLNSGKVIIDIKGEIEQVESYLKIQQIRYKDTLDYQINIDKEVYRYKIPKLSMQPIVENAIYHGIRNRRRKGEISIYGEVVGDDIWLYVKDNGIGMLENDLENLKKSIYMETSKSHGLINVHKRLKLYCGENYGLYFTSEYDKGTIVKVVISKEFQLSH
ncbi:MAG: sensor histidine kinase [Lachnospirales bacterium]